MTGLLQVQMATNFLQIPVYMHCTHEGYEAYDKTFIPRTPHEKLENMNNPVHILWCKLTDDATVPNHLAPLVHCTNSKTGIHKLIRTRIRINNEDSFKCNACQFVGKVVDGGEVLQCRHCLIWYHRKCCEFSVMRQQRMFSCGCAANIDCQWYVSHVFEDHN